MQAKKLGFSLRMSLFTNEEAVLVRRRRACFDGCGYSLSEYVQLGPQPQDIRESG
jgi:hypothetical protein